MRFVAAIPACGLLAGCALGLLVPDWPASAALSTVVASVIGGWWAARSKQDAMLSLVVAVAFAAGGALLASRAWKAAWRSSVRVVFDERARAQRADARAAGQPLPEDESAELVLVGTLTADAAPSRGGVLLSVEARWVGDPSARLVSPGPASARPAASSRLDDVAVNPVAGGILLTVVGSMSSDYLGQWTAGRTIRAPVRLRRPTRYLDPGVPDHERAMARRGTALVGTVKSGSLVEVVERGSVPAELAARIRFHVRRTIGSCVGRWSQRSAAIVTAIIIGDRTGLDDEVERKLQEAGTYHVIAISGGNIAILAGLTLAAFRLAGLLGKAAMASAMIGLVAYAFLVGGGVSVDRATLMSVLYFAGRMLDLRGPPLNALAVVGALQTLANPLTVSDPAFLLTFGATTGILVFAPRFWVRRAPPIASAALSILVASAAAELMLVPVSAALFSRVTFAGLALNFAAIPLMAVAQVAGMATVPIYVVSERLGAATGWVAAFGADWLVRSAELTELVPVVAWRVGRPSAIAVVTYYAGLAGAIVAWLQGSPTIPCAAWRRRVLGPSGAGVACAAAVWILFEPATLLRGRGDGQLHVTFIDVGQGDAALLQFPGGDTLLVDTGGVGGSASFDLGDRVVAPVLRHAGIRRLGTLALSHGDADHIGGAASLIREFRPWEIWEGIPVPRSQPLESLRVAARTAGSRWANVQTADLVRIGEVEVIVRHPGLPDWERQAVRNNDSIVLELVWRDISIVLAGDVGEAAEAAIAHEFAPIPLRVLKVPHHGSASSSSQNFVRALSPRLAVVSVGRGNRFGHPAPAVLERYAAAGAEIFRTDRDGAVTIDTDGASLDVRGYTGRRIRLVPRTRTATGPERAPVP